MEKLCAIYFCHCDLENIFLNGFNISISLNKIKVAEKALFVKENVTHIDMFLWFNYICKESKINDI
jgi:hypothetical protein